MTEITMTALNSQHRYRRFCKLSALAPQLVIYDGWEWETTGKVLQADIGTDDKDIMKQAKVEIVDKTGARLTFEFSQSILDKLAKAKLLTIDFEDDEDNSVEIKIPRAGEALAALKFCEENKK
jgi:hypothetical protein